RMDVPARDAQVHLIDGGEPGELLGQLPRFENGIGHALSPLSCSWGSGGRHGGLQARFQRGQVHAAQVRVDAYRCEVHLIEYVFAHVDARGDLDERQTVFVDAEHGALRHDRGLLAVPPDAVTHAIRDVRSVADELAHLAFLDDLQLASLDLDLES